LAGEIAGLQPSPKKFYTMADQYMHTHAQAHSINLYLNHDVVFVHEIAATCQK
jgi:hypothetical protein